MKSGAGIVLVIGFGVLLVLITLLGAGVIRRTDEMSRQAITARQAYQELDDALRNLPTDILLTSILIRDYLLDSSPAARPGYIAQLEQQQKAIREHVTRLGALGSIQSEKIERLRGEIQAYVASMDPVLEWTPEEKAAQSLWFIRHTWIPRRQAIVGIARELHALNAEKLMSLHQTIVQGRVSLQRFVGDLVRICLALGLVVAFASTWRVVKLDRRGRLERERAEEAEREQRRLAARVVHAQEEERKRISLELHDAVGQMASALGIELGRLDSLHRTSPAQFQGKLAEVKQLNSDVVRAVKDLASGLRPAMLDELGLGPALRSHAREFSRRTGIAAEVRLEGQLDTAPEPHRTCIYRVVQEALNNCSRHSGAKRVLISLYAGPDSVSLAVQDDGTGFHAERKSKTGLGLIGIAERARGLGGTMKITSRPGNGTLLEVEIPVTDATPA